LRVATLLVSARASVRLAAARAWLGAQPHDTEFVIVGASQHAADDLLRFELASSAAMAARSGALRTTLDRAAARLAAGPLSREQRVPATSLSLTAVVARAIYELSARGGLEHFAGVSRRPSFASAMTRTVEELRMHDVRPVDLLGRARGGSDLAALLEQVERELAAAGLADRAFLFRVAAEAARAERMVAPAGVPLLLLDVAVRTPLEERFVAALARTSPDVFATAAAGDTRTITALEHALRCAPQQPPSIGDGPLAAIQDHLFEDTGPTGPPVTDGSVTLRSWPGEARECVEIARQVLAEAARGVSFDRIAVALRSPGEYRSQVEEAFRRADIPAAFARGSTRPERGGRALLALLACAAEGLTARRFAEYLSLAQVPDDPATRAPRWVPPDDDLLPDARAESSEVVREPASDERAVPMRAPWRWERLIVDAAVIGGRDRWARRLAGLAEELTLRRAALDDADEARIGQLERQRADLEHLRAVALPIIDQLAALPGRAPWGTWLEHLRALAAGALRDPDIVLAMLAELAPMGPIGPVDLDEIQLVLAPRLRDLAVRPPTRRYGAVFVGPPDALRGMVFDVVFVPGLAEKLFPRKVIEDPILHDAERGTLATATTVNGAETASLGMFDSPSTPAEGGRTLPLQADRVATERLALRIAAGAARERLHLSFPRLDVEQGRARVPSFYGLEALGAIEGTVPGFDELRRRAESDPLMGAPPARLGWPAPERPQDAIDEAEFDLAVLAGLGGADTKGAGAYLLSANPHLARTLRARARRWLRRWTYADGLVDPDPLGREALEPHRLGTRSYSPTGLQHFASCPYRFFLQAVHRLEPREEPIALESVDPLTRGALFHETQFGVMTGLRDRGLLPLHPADLEQALELADRSLDAVAAAYFERLAPAIPRVWEDGIQAIRGDLREWLYRGAHRSDGWVPHRFELSFGIADRDRPNADPGSVAEPIPIVAGVRLRGSIDLIERHSGSHLRVTDHKTGKARAPDGVVVGGGKILQPVLYALACERLLGEPVDSGRLYYCTADGGFEERTVPLDETAREHATRALEIVGRALEEGFLPAAPEPRACAWCDYRPVCGPHEESRVRRKPPDRLTDLNALRGLP
jgi:ATP-dependent helicase/nuclease subunit B